MSKLSLFCIAAACAASAVVIADDSPFPHIRTGLWKLVETGRVPWSKTNSLITKTVCLDASTEQLMSELLGGLRRRKPEEGVTSGKLEWNESTFCSKIDIKHLGSRVTVDMSCGTDYRFPQQRHWSKHSLVVFKGDTAVHAEEKTHYYEDKADSVDNIDGKWIGPSCPDDMEPGDVINKSAIRPEGARTSLLPP